VVGCVVLCRGTEEQRGQEHIVLRNMQELKIQLEDLAEMHADEVSETKAQVSMFSLGFFVPLGQHLFHERHNIAALDG
jgi:hypothetical protein